MVRARFAPSPTGYLHVGSAASALFNWLFVRANGGEFHLRIEDTDADRNRPELTDNILESLRWLGLDWDGEIVHQSDNRPRHKQVIEQLAASGQGYWCDCTREEVEARNKAAGRPPGYDNHCRERGLEAGPGRALRFKSPLEGQTSWVDYVRGEVTFENAKIEDFVIARADGSPLFIVANAIDDADMGITHVIRGEDHINNTPKYILLWQAAIERDVPRFAHLPLLVNEGRKKLSKRRDVVSVADFRAAGYLPEAMRNYLALLGWGPRDGVEIRPIEEIVAQFKLDDVSPSSAFFDTKKLRHFNGHYIRELPTERFVELASEFVPAAARGALEELAQVTQERVAVLTEVADMIAFRWTPDFAVPAEIATQLQGDEQGQSMLAATVAALADVAWDTEAVQEAVKQAGVDAGFVNAEGNVRLSKAQAPVRLAITGAKVGLPLWEAIVSLGRDEAVRRLNAVRG